MPFDHAGRTRLKPKILLLTPASKIHEMSSIFPAKVFEIKDQKCKPQSDFLYFMIHIILGTKAQLIKVAPVMVELQKRKIDYNFISTGQHKENMKKLIEVFSLKKYDYIVYKGKDITQISQIVIWTIQCLLHTFKNKKRCLKIKGSYQKNGFKVGGLPFLSRRFCSEQLKNI